MEREQFTFYASFAKAIQKIRKSSDRAVAYDAIVNYALYGTMPDLDKLPDSVCIVFELTKPNLDASRRKAQGGKSGSKSKDDAESIGSSDEDTDKITVSSEEDTDNKKEKEDKKEDKKEDEEEKKKENKRSPLTPQRREQMVYEAFSEHRADLPVAVLEWVQYKIEKRQPYQETGLRNLLAQIRNSAEEYGDAAMVDVIRRSMSANYQGIVFDWLKSQHTQMGRNVSTANKPASVLPMDELMARINSI